MKCPSFEEQKDRTIMQSNKDAMSNLIEFSLICKNLLLLAQITIKYRELRLMAELQSNSFPLMSSAIFFDTQPYIRWQ